MTGPQSKQDVDRIRQRAGKRKVVIARVAKIVSEYRDQGRAASACMADIEKAMREVKP